MSTASSPTESAAPARRRMSGIGRVLVVVYAVMALGATGRSFVQIAERFDEAPLAYTLSAVSAAVYIVATLALIFAGSRAWYRVAWVAIVFELVGVLVIGTLSLRAARTLRAPHRLVVVRVGVPVRAARAALLRHLVARHPQAGGTVIVFREPAEVPEGFGPSVVAIGKFDGVHAGHRALIEKAKVDAAATGARVVAVTFDRNPLSVLRPEICPPQLIGVHQKLQLLAEAGVDATLMLHFDEQLAALPAREFVEHVLVGALAVKTVLVGRTSGSAEGERATSTCSANSVASGASRSTWCTTCGRSTRAGGSRRPGSANCSMRATSPPPQRLLGRPASVWGEVVHGLKRGRELGYPTANLSAELEGFVPADGVYAGLADRPGLRRRASLRHPLPRRHLGRHEPHLRRRARAPGRGVRPG